MVGTNHTSSSFDTSNESQDESRINGDKVEELAYSATAMADLRVIVDCMLANEYAKDCISIDQMVQKSNIDEPITPDSSSALLRWHHRKRAQTRTHSRDDSLQ